MEYSDYSLKQIFENAKNYQEVCNLFFQLVTNDDIKEKLESILYKGGYKEFGISSKITNRDNPFIEMKRRISMAYLLIRNPETFDILVQNKINLFHGTNANALPSILKYGLNSLYDSEAQGIYVSTGEKWSRIIGKSRDFISFTDVLDLAEDYSTLTSDKGKNNLSFEVVIGTTVDDVKRAGKCVVQSEVPEVGVRNKLPIESIRMIGVPSEKVEFVKKIVNNDEIKVLALDGIREKFYYIDDFVCNISIIDNLFNKLQNDLRKSSGGVFFKLEEIKRVMIGWLSSKVIKVQEGKDDVIGGESLEYDGRSR